MSDERRADTQPDAAPTDGVPAKPDRPAAVELAAAILIVTGSVGLFAALAFSRGLPPGTEVIFLSTVIIGIASIVLGVLVRRGRVWFLTINFAAVLGFLDLLNAGTSPLSLMLGLSDLLVVGLLISNKRWFDAMRDWRAALQAERERPISP
jgi:hypothetical protein